MKSAVIRWLHLSDFHVGKDAYEGRRLFKEILTEVAVWKDTHAFLPHYVFITGDIANKGSAAEYDTFRSAFMRPIQESLGHGCRVIPIPGNHDVARPTTDMLDRPVALKSGTRFFDPTKEGKRAREPVFQRFRNYRSRMAAHVSPAWIASHEGALCDIQLIDGARVGVVGINTAWLSKGDDDKDHLTPGFRLVEAALERIRTCDVRVVLGHHPLSWFHEEEERHIRALFGRVNVVYLHGHMHRSEGKIEEGGSDNFLVLQAGAAFQARDSEEWVNGFSWGEFDLEKREVRVSPRYWDSVNNEWPPKTGAISLKRKLGESDWWGFPLPGALLRSKSTIAARTQPTRGFVRDRSRQSVTAVRINGYKLFYYRLNHKLTFGGLANATGLNRSALRKLERIKASKGVLDVSRFASCDRAALSQLEEILDCRGKLEAGRPDDFLTQYMMFYQTYKGSSPAAKRVIDQLPLSFETRVVVFDFDGTLTKPSDNSTTWEKLWVKLGYSADKCFDLHRRFRQNEFTHQEWCNITRDAFRAKGLNREQVAQIAGEIELVDGIKNTIETLRKKGIALFILSGSIKSIIRRALGPLYTEFDEVRANELSFDSNGLISQIRGTIYDFEGKAIFLKRIIEDMKLSPSDILYVGNSCNDIFASQSGARTLCVNARFTDPDNEEHWTYAIREMVSLDEILKFAQI